MTGPKIVHESSFGKPSARASCQQLDQRDQIAKRVQVKPGSRSVDAFAGVGLCEVSPFPSDGEAAALGITQDQRVDPGDASRLQHSKALTSTRMERMPNLGPT